MGAAGWAGAGGAAASGDKETRPKQKVVDRNETRRRGDIWIVFDNIEVLATNF
jgi:hypothetical protein